MTFFVNPVPMAADAFSGRATAVPHSAPHRQFAISLQGTVFCFPGAF